MGAPDVQTLVREIYEAVLEPERWGDLLRRSCAFTGGEQAALGITEIGDGTAAIGLMHEGDPVAYDRWLTEFEREDPWAREASDLRPGMVATGAQLRPVDDLRRLAVYRGYLGPIGIDDSLSIIMDRDGGELSAVRFYRCRRRGAFGRQEIARAELLAPHFVLAAKLHRRIAVLTAYRQLDEQALDRMPYGVVGLDASGRVISWNRAAQRLLDAADGLVVRSGRLHAPRASAALEHAIRDCAQTARGESTAGGASLAIPRAPLRRPLHILVCPVPSPGAPVAAALPVGRPRMLVLVTDPDSVREPPLESVCRIFRLTPALARLAVALAMGRTLAEYAEEADLSIETVRSELKQLMARVGASRQAELVRLILSSVASIEL